MGLKETIQSAVVSGFTALGNVKRTVTLKNKSNPTYVPTTQTITDSSTSYSVTGVLARYSVREIDGTVIKPNDQKFLFPQKDLTFSPNSIDVVIDEDGSEWSVVNISKDPADAVWVLQLRRAGG